MVRGDIYFVALSPRSGSEQRGRRPSIIVSTDAFNEVAGWRTVTVVPLTSGERWVRESPTSVVFERGESSLPKRCAALAHQITTVDRSKLTGKKAGVLSEAKQRALDAAIRNYLSL